MRKSDPSNIAGLQRQFLKCLLARKTHIKAYLLTQLAEAKQRQNQKQQDPYSAMFQQPHHTDPQFLIPMLSVSIYNDIHVCLQNFLTKSFKDGCYTIVKSMPQRLVKPNHALQNFTIESANQKSYDLIKSALFNLCAKLYSQSQINDVDLKSDVDKALTLSLTNIALTESMRQKVLGAVNTLKSAGIKKVLVQAEYRTAGDNHVCPKCEAYERKVMSVDEIEQLIPQHPRCRCWFSIID